MSNTSHMSQAPEDFEGERLQLLQQTLDPLTIRHFERLGVQKGWRCLEVGE